MQKPIGKFITEEEKENLITELKVSGMFLSGGEPMGHPQEYCRKLCEKYNMSIDKYAINANTGEFIQVEDNQ